MIRSFYAAAAAVALVPAVAYAGSGQATGVAANGMQWKAKSNIIGQNSTAIVSAGGNPLYLAHNVPKFRAVVQLRMDYGAAGAFVCSGALMSNGRILTAAHCISSGYKNNVNGRDPALLSTTAYFYTGTGQGDDPLMQIGGVPQAGVIARSVISYSTNFGYTGDVIDQNDIAVLTLAGGAPLGFTGYDLYTGGDLTGADFNVAGYGLRSLTGGQDGYGNGQALGTGRLREGDNTYDYRFGDPVFGGFFTAPDANGDNWFGGKAAIDFSYVSDFDNGNAANDANCLAVGFCDLGLGMREVSIAGGDSGGPGFINGQLASVNSYGLTFGSDFGDVDDALNSSWGELNGFVPTFIHAAWIASVPEPSTWALLILGFGVAGAAMRRKKAEARYAF